MKNGTGSIEVSIQLFNQKKKRKENKVHLLSWPRLYHLVPEYEAQSYEATQFTSTLTTQKKKL